MSEKIYEMVTDKIIEKLEQGTVPWQKPWVSGGLPKSLVSGKTYRGVNVFLLAIQDYSSPYWLTLKQANDRGGKVRKGEKSTPVIFWNWINKEDKDNPDKVKKIPFLKYYRVFNVEQCDGLNFPQEEVARPLNRITECEKVVSDMPKAPRLTHGGNHAYYRPSEDVVNMPASDGFVSDEEYYSTLFHELTHSTGHESRVGREGIKDVQPFGTVDYGKEELVAEMGAAFLCGITGINNKTVDNSAAYINSWLKKIRQDKKIIVQAAAAAQKASDFILGKSYKE
jgi:antirestriction protein ArdC